MLALQVAKWTAGALLSGADQIKLGFVSRATPRDVSNHVVLAMHVSGWECLKGFGRRWPHGATWSLGAGHARELLGLRVQEILAGGLAWPARDTGSAREGRPSH